MNAKNGIVIAVVGGPRSGKSFLVDLLAKHYGGVAVLEEQDFPERICEDIEKNIRPLERIIWFRNKMVKAYFHALEMKSEGKVVVMDTFWVTYQLYIETLTEGFEREVILDIAEIDRLTLQWPDITIFLSHGEQGVRDFIKRGGRLFDQSEEYIQNQALPIHKIHDDFFNRVEVKKKVIKIPRDGMDFSNEKDFKNLLKKIDTFNQ